MHAPFDTARDEVGVLQNTYMFRDGRLGDLEWLSQLTCRALTPSRQQRQHFATRTITESVKRTVELHLITNSHLAIFDIRSEIVKPHFKREQSMVAPSQTETVVIRRRYAAKPEVVFELWTQPEWLAKWLRPSAEFTHRVVEVDARVGGRYRFAFVSPEGRVDVVGGEYLEVVPPERLAFSWIWEPPNEHAGIESKVTVDFHRVEGETELVLSHGLANQEMRQRHMEGWNGALEQIPELIDEIKGSEPRDA